MANQGPETVTLLNVDQQLALSSLFGWLFSTKDEQSRVCLAAEISLEPALSPDKAWARIFASFSQSELPKLKRLMRAALEVYPEQPGLTAFLTYVEVLEKHGLAKVLGLEVAPVTEAAQPVVTAAPSAAAAAPSVTGPSVTGPSVTGPAASQNERLEPVSKEEPHSPEKAPSSPSARKAPVRPTHVRAVKLFMVASEVDAPLWRPLEARLQAATEAGWFKSLQSRVLGDPAGWRRKVSSHLEAADLVVWAVSDRFLQSGYLKEDEADWTLELARRGQARLVIVALSSSAWRDRIKGKLFAFPESDALDAQRDLEAAYEEVLEGILKVSEEVRYR